MIKLPIVYLISANITCIAQNSAFLEMDTFKKGLKHKR